MLADVFTATIFGGNPLAVITDARGLSSEQMQKIAREFNFSETTFVLPPEAAGAQPARGRIVFAEFEIASPQGVAMGRPSLLEAYARQQRHRRRGNDKIAGTLNDSTQRSI
ncbi:MAG TPA: PhzF family phenazine biosynthesis protein [Steroidobacteraceae bacterium]